MVTPKLLQRTAISTAFLLASLAMVVEAAPKAATPVVESTASTTTEGSTQLGKPTKVHFRVGAEITASRGACKNILAMVTVPLDCPEQKVTIISEDFSPEVRDVTYRP